MSRTGVGCRVMIDGKQLDDGCIDWGAPAPGTELRRNRATHTKGINGALPAAGFGPTIGRWFGAGGAGTYSLVTGAVDGPVGITQYLRKTWTTADTNNGDSGFYISNGASTSGVAVTGVPVIAGTTYTLSLYLRSSIGGQTSAMQVYWRDAAGTYFAQASGISQTLPVNAWTRETLTVTAPANAAFLGAVADTDGGTLWTVGSTLDATGAMVEVAAAASAFFDGDTPDTATVDYGWTGAQNASMSVGLVPVPPYAPVGEGVVASSGLGITWGRSNTIDQPASSSCTFSVVDVPGGIGVLDAVRIGARVDVYADATISGGAGEPVFTDPSFSTELRASVKNATATRTQLRADDPGGWSAAVAAVDSGALATVNFPPGPLQIDGTNPAAWASLRTTKPGETWKITIRVYVPSGVAMKVRPVLYDGPYATAATVGTTTTTVATHDAWTTATLSFAPGAGSWWVGFQVELSGGLTWGTLGDAFTWQSIGPDFSWGDLGTAYVDTVSVVPPAGGTGSTVQVFSGRITDLEGFYDDAWDAPMMSVTASDFLADLGNRYIGDVPWSVESVAVRVAHILALAAIPGENPVAIDIASTLTAIPITAMDVDSRAAAGLLTDIAQSVDGVLWSATHPAIGPYMRLEDPAQRLTLYTFALNGGVIVIVPDDFSNAENPPPPLSACDILRDPVSFIMSVADIATRVDATYQEQPVPPATDTTERHVKLVKSTLETQYGTRAVSIQTELTTAADTNRVAEQLVARLNGAWRVEGLVFADADVTTPDATAARSLMTLLNGVTRGGQALLLTDLDSWSPVGDTAPVYLEGGSYTFIDGGWSLSLSVSRGSGFGQTAKWDDMPNDSAWKWDAFDPSLTWESIRGVAAP